MESPLNARPFATEANMSLALHGTRFAGGFAASAQDEAFGGATFTRDTCRVIRDTMSVPGLSWMAREMLGILPQTQGMTQNDTTNESFNAMPHEVFFQKTANRFVSDKTLERVEYWTGQWGVPMQYNPTDGKWFAVYNSSDGPALYLLALAEYNQLYPHHNILRDRFTHRLTDEDRTVGEAGRRCVQFIMDALARCEEQSHGFYAVPNTNRDQTSPSSVMRDGSDSYYYPLGERGVPVDFSKNIAYIDNQGLVYDALIAAATQLYPDDASYTYPGKDNTKPTDWINKARDLRRRALTAFWMEDAGTFASALDGIGAQVKQEGTAALELLKGSFLKVPDGPDIVRCLVNWMYDKHVMTPIGPRMLHEKFGKYEGDYYAYQGSGAVWNHVTGIIADGLQHDWQLYGQAYDLGVLRMLGGFNRSRRTLELDYVERGTNQPVYTYDPTIDRTNARRIAASSIGQPGQGWAASAGDRVLRDTRDWVRRGVPENPRGSWQRAFSQKIDEQMRAVKPAAWGVPAEPLDIDTAEGQRLKEAWAEAMHSA